MKTLMKLVVPANALATGANAGLYAEFGSSISLGAAVVFGLITIHLAMQDVAMRWKGT